MPLPHPQAASIQQLLPEISDPAIAGRVWQEFCRPLIIHAACRLGSDVRSRLDPEDVVQTCFRTFLRRSREGEFRGIESLDQLRGLLSVLIARRASNKRRYHLQKIRSARSTGPLEPAEWAVLSQAPTPAELAESNDTLETLVKGLSDSVEEDRDKEIVRRTVAGQTKPEIAAAVDCSVRTVERVYERLRRHAEQILVNELGREPGELR